MKRTCNICNKLKGKKGFEKGRNQCRKCRNNYRKTLKTRTGDGLRDYNLKKMYNISLTDYNQMVTNQNNKCNICNKINESGPWNNKLVVDHCHKTGKIRALLCDKCNKGLGQFNDNVEVMKKAILYLLKFKE